ncbi:hypothetical protein [Streptomyces sp. Qhu_M48]|uniref:hypothetical protein n=1 Tax=Streptomyces sp. Qhu_M48 TaxID=3435889 RepID=UPI003F4FEAD0
MVMVHLFCKAASKYLVGDYQSGKTRLGNRDEPGTRWEMSSLGAGQFTFLNLRDLDLTNFFDALEAMNEDRYLDGNTHTGTVQLVRHTGEPFTGTKWLRSPGPDNSVVFTCLGVADGARLLDGRPGHNTVQLMPNNGFAGTRWAVETPT